MTAPVTSTVFGALFRGRTAADQGLNLPARRGPYRRFGKRALDVLFVLISLPVTLPLILLFAALVAIQGGSPFYAQSRIGLGGRVFRMWKLRTMAVDADRVLEAHLASDPKLRHEWDTTQKLKRDPRITPLGRFLRKSSMDELPQIWNVLLGEMSLVGPRPMMPQQRPLYHGEAYFALRPGLTGLWQISDRNEGYFASRAEFDTEYYRSLSLSVDLQVMARTLPVVARGTGY